MRKLLWTATLGLLLVAPAALVQDQDRHPNRDRRDRIEDRRDRREDVRDRREDVRDRLARIIHEEADYSRKTNAPVWYKGCAHRPFATTEALA